jgi:hypothetical protein
MWWGSLIDYAADFAIGGALDEIQLPLSERGSAPPARLTHSHA